jgi:exoribonuclease R
MLDLKKAEFMLHHLNEPAPATVVSVVRSGAFVELDAYPIDGLVRQDDGPRTRRPFRLGERLVVEATAASLERRQVDFALVDRSESKHEGRDRRSRTKPGKRRARPRR